MHLNMHIWPYLAYLGAYLGAQNMVKWGVPEKILQNAVEARLADFPAVFFHISYWYLS